MAGTTGGSPRAAAASPAPRRTGAASGAFRVLLALTLICGALLLALSDGLVTAHGGIGGGGGRWTAAAAMGLSRSLLDDYVLPWLSNRERLLLVAVTGCEDHAALARLLAALPPDPDVDVVCMLSEDALGYDANATAVADAHDVRVVAVHAGGWAAAWGAALRLLRDEGGEALLLVQSDVVLPPQSLGTLRAALRVRPDVDVMLPVVATTHALGLADGVRLPPALGSLLAGGGTGGGSGGSPQYPGWIAAALDAAGAPAAPAGAAAPAPHPLRSYQLLVRVHPWLPEVLRANVSAQAAVVQAALLAVNLPGSTLVPPHVVELPRATGGGYAFSEPLSLAVGRGFLQRHAATLAAAGVLSDVAHGDLHASEAEAEAADNGGGEGSDDAAAEDGNADGAAAAGGGRRLQAAASDGNSSAAATTAAAPVGAVGSSGVNVALLQRSLSATATFGVATRALLVHVPAQPTGDSVGFGAAAAVPATDAGGVAAGGEAAAASVDGAPGSGARRRRRVIGVPWTGPDLPSGRGDQRVIAVFHRGQLLRRVRGKGRGRGRAFKARWSTESAEPLPAAWAELTAGMEGTPIVVDIDLLPPLPPGVPTPAGLAGVTSTGAVSPAAAGDEASPVGGGLGSSRHAARVGVGNDGAGGGSSDGVGGSGRRRRRRGRQHGAGAAAAAAAAAPDGSAGAERRQRRQQQGNATAAAPAAAPSLPPLTPQPPPSSPKAQAPAAAAPAAPPKQATPPQGSGDKKDVAGGKGQTPANREKRESESSGGSVGSGNKPAAASTAAASGALAPPPAQQQRTTVSATNSSTERGATQAALADSKVDGAKTRAGDTKSNTAATMNKGGSKR